MGIFAPIDNETISVPRLNFPRDRREPSRIIYAQYESNAGNTIDNNSMTIIDFEDKVEDTHNIVTTGASWKATFPRRAYVIALVGILYVSTDTWADGESARLWAYKNGSQHRPLDFLDLGSGSAFEKGLFGIWGNVMNPGDYVDFRTIQTSGAGLALNSAASANYVVIYGFS